jgi:hypothetical protein
MAPGVNSSTRDPSRGRRWARDPCRAGKPGPRGCGHAKRRVRPAAGAARRVPDGAGRAESLAAAQLPEGARGSRAALCPPASAGEREYVVTGARDGGVVVWDASRPGQPPIVVNKLQARAHRVGCL